MSHANKVSKSWGKLKYTLITYELNRPFVQESIVSNEWKAGESKGKNHGIIE